MEMDKWRPVKWKEQWGRVNWGVQEAERMVVPQCSKDDAERICKDHNSVNVFAKIASDVLEEYETALHAIPDWATKPYLEMIDRIKNALEGNEG